MEMSYRQPGPQNVIQIYSGLVMNGLVPNGLVPNGLDPNGLGNGEPERAEMGAKRPISQRVKIKVKEIPSMIQTPSAEMLITFSLFNIKISLFQNEEVL